MIFILIGLLLAFTHKHHDLGNDISENCLVFGGLELGVEAIVVIEMLIKSGVI